MFNTVRVAIFIFLLSPLFPNTGIAQPPGNGAGDGSTGLDFLASEDEMPASFSNKAQEAAEKYVTHKGWKMGRNDGGRYVAVGSGDILGKPSSPKFQLKRRNAFTKAMADAKRQIAQYYSQTVAREIAHSYAEGSPSVASEMMSTGEKKAPEEIGILEKTKMLINAELDAKLKKKGIDPGSKEAEKAVGEMLGDPQQKSSFSDKISRMANAEVGALITKKIFEDSGDVAVVATYTANTKQLAAAMMGKGKAPNVRKRTSTKSISDWIQSMSKKDLYPMCGVQLTSDYDGNLVIISYAQAAAQGASKMSRRNAVMAAETNADGYIRSFVGETVAFNNVKQNLEKNAQYNDEEIETQVERVQKTDFKADAKGLNLTGIQTIRTWTTQDKRSGTNILGVVRRWDIRSATAALDEAQKFDNVGAGKGGQGLSQSKRKGSQRTSQKASTKETVPSKSGGNYGHQSMESEDF